MSTLRRALCALPGALALAALPASYAPGPGLRPAAAECQTGTCCAEPGSTCIIGSWLRPDKYAKLDGTACTKAPPETQPTGAE